jgi:polysaccharide pyruvyl transferase WcaK-like protein
MSNKAKNPVISLFGVFGAGNLGNECTLQALLYNLRKQLPGAKINCICTGPGEVAATYGIDAVPIKEGARKGKGPAKSKIFRILRKIVVGIPTDLLRWRRAVRVMRGCDMLVMTGTGMLGDFGISAFGLHYEILRWSIAAKLSRTKLLFVSVGAGPIHDPLSRRFVKAALSLADYRSYRDSFSKEYMESIGFKANADSVYPDLAFSLPRTEIPKRHNRNGSRPVIGVGVITYFDRRSRAEDADEIYRNYIGKIADLVRWLIDHQYRVRLLIGDVVYDQRVREDLKVVLEAQGVSYRDGQLIDEPAESLADVLTQLASTDMLIASRFHNVLLGLMVTQLVVAISYHQKVEALVSGVGLQDFCQDIEELKIDKLIQQVTTLDQMRDAIRPKIEARTELYRTELDEQYTRIFNMA